MIANVTSCPRRAGVSRNITGLSPCRRVLTSHPGENKRLMQTGASTETVKKAFDWLQAVTSVTGVNCDAWWGGAGGAYSRFKPGKSVANDILGRRRRPPEMYRSAPGGRFMTWQDLLAGCVAKPAAWQDERWEGDAVAKAG